MASSGDAAKIEFVGEIRDVKDKVGQMEVAFGRLTKEIQKTAKASADASRQKLPVKDAQDMASAFREGALQLGAQVLGLEAVRRAVMAVIEAQERAATKGMAAVDRMAQLASRMGARNIGGIRGQVEGFSRGTGFTADQSVEIFERGFGADTSLGASQSMARSAAFGRMADKANVKDAAGFVEGGMRLMKMNPNLSPERAGELAFQLQRAGVTDIGGFAEQFGGNTDAAVAMAIAASKAGQAPELASNLVGKMRGAQAKGFAKADRSERFLFGPGGRPLDPVELIMGGQVPGSFLESEMTRGNKSDSAKRFLSALPGAKSEVAAGGLLAGVQRALANDPAFQSGERTRDAQAAAYWNEANRGLAPDERRNQENIEKLKAGMQSNVLTGAIANIPYAANMINAQTNALAGLLPNMPGLPKLQGEGASPADYMNAVRSVGLRSAPGMQIEVRVRNAGEQASRDSY